MQRILTRFIALPAFLVGILFFLSSCSVVEFAYNNAPAYLEDRIDDAFALNADQRDVLGEEMERFFQWHRKAELPIYAQVLEQAADDLEDGLQPPELLHVVDGLQAAGRRLADAAAPGLGRLLSDINDEQLQNFDRAFQERIEEDLERLALPPEQRLEDQAEVHLERFEDWYGDFDWEQRDKAMAILMTLPDFHGQWMAHRQARHRAFLAFMGTHPDAETIEHQIHAWWVTRTEGVSPEYEASRQRFWQIYAEKGAEIDALLTQDQRDAARARMNEYASVFRQLAKR